MKSSISLSILPLLLFTSLSAFAGIRDSGGPAGDPSEMEAARYLPVQCSDVPSSRDSQTTVKIDAVRIPTPVDGRSYRFDAVVQNFGLGINVRASTEITGTAPVRFVDKASAGAQFDLAIDMSTDLGSYHYAGRLTLPGRQTINLICVFGGN